MSIKSPCILVCSIDRATGWCFGCGRTADEIGLWMSFSDLQRDAVMAQLPARLEKIVRPERRVTRRRQLARQRGNEAG